MFHFYTRGISGWYNIFMRHLTALTMALILLSACVPVAPAPYSSGLVVAAPRGVVSAALEAAAQDYSQAHGEAVRLEVFNSADYAARADAVLLAGLDRYDLVYLPAEELAKWAGYHALQPLDLDGGAPGDLAALAPWLPDVTVAGKRYGLPVQPDALVLWYRADLLASAMIPVPRDWPDLRQAAQALNQPPERYGVALVGSDVEAGQDFAAVLAGFGGQAVADQQAVADKQASGDKQAVGERYQVEINGPVALRALEFYTALRPLAAPGVSGFTRASVLIALSSGRAVFGIAPLSAAGTLLDCKANPKVCREGRPLLAWSWLPGMDEQTAVGSLGAWAVPLHTAHADQAQGFAAWLASEAGARAWAQGGGVPAHTGVLAGASAGARLAKVKTYRLAFPPLATEAELMKACTSAVSSAVNGKQTPSQALEAAAEQMRVALRKGGY